MYALQSVMAVRSVLLIENEIIQIVQNTCGTLEESRQFHPTLSSQIIAHLFEFYRPCCRRQRRLLGFLHSC